MSEDSDAEYQPPLAPGQMTSQKRLPTTSEMESMPVRPAKGKRGRPRKDGLPPGSARNSKTRKGSTAPTTRKKKGEATIVGQEECLEAVRTSLSHSLQDLMQDRTLLTSLNDLLRLQHPTATSFNHSYPYILLKTLFQL